MPTTLKDIAAKSGYSVTTVSRALTGYDDVNEQTRMQIQRIADELGYQPNHVARQLQQQRTHTLGLIMPARDHNADDDFFSMLLKGITYEAARNGYDVIVGAARNPDEEMQAYQRIAGGKRIDGMLVARTHRNDPRIDYLRTIQCPFIVHGRLTPDESSDFHFIDVDSYRGIAMLTEHLLERGHRHIGIILPPEDIAFTPYRYAGYYETLLASGITPQPSYCETSDLTYEGGQQGAYHLLERHPELTAIIGANDWMALGAMHVAKDRGLAVGKSFAIAGYDDIPAAMHADPGLTTIHQPIYNIGEDLTQALIGIIDEKQPTAGYVQRLIQPSLIVRDSSG